MSAFTDTLAQVRRGIAEPHRANNRHEYKTALAALDRVEQLAADMEKALTEIALMDKWGYAGGAKNIARAVLSAREEGTA